ncbi:MAG: DUF1501 domain-containing protein [Maricaulis sp.]|uniref:DUF1501 domain-containing protein n=1 Tax=Maricaulis sp. TaxID=1486257 RepID=UPI001B2337C9|nr:DUF1501 domain-containing protein [Maricaulis sp.]MBO6729505.1 DUF1501 domain-containing protein [Maricaulis sp.]MBO6878894.1 DUF1501 domain-containing protein [Maricaulis sp.]
MTGPRLDRRALLTVLAASGVVLAGAPASFSQSRSAKGRKLVVVILRGALDGLAALAPVGDRRYRELRGDLALSDGLPAAGPFVFHPSLQHVSELYTRGELLALHAVATDYRERSHFDGQDHLEAGTTAIRDGWLNRALAVMGGAAPDAVGIGQSLPLLLRGAAPVSTWAPAVLPGADDDTIARLMDMYARDPMLGPALAMALETDEAASAMAECMEGMRGMNARGSGPHAYRIVTEAAGNIMAAPGGPDAAVIGLHGWDTHVRQGAADGQLANRLAGLDQALAGLKDRLNRQWNQTAVLVVTEFGRTVRANGAGGTDHGTGGAAFLLGGAVRGGRIIGDWPGLDQLHEGRDLIPANNLTSLFKAVLAEHWGLDLRDIDRAIFPETLVGGFSGLIG